MYINYPKHVFHLIKENLVKKKSANFETCNFSKKEVNEILNVSDLSLFSGCCETDDREFGQEIYVSCIRNN